MDVTMTLWSFLSVQRLLLTLTTLLLALVIGAAIRLAASRRHTARLLSRFPGPQLHWFWGCFDKGIEDEAAIRRMRGWSLSHGSAFSVWFGPLTARLLVNDPATIGTLLSKEDTRSPLVKFLKPYVGDGLFTIEGAKWHRKRRLLTPIFHLNTLKPYVAIVSDTVNIMMDLWRDKIETVDSVEIFRPLGFMTLDGLLRCIYNYDSDCQRSGKQQPFVEATEVMATQIMDRLKFPPYHIDALYHLSPSGRRMVKGCEVLQKYTRDIIEEHKQQQRDQARQYIGKKTTHSFVHLLLNARDEDGKGFTDKEIQDDVTTFTAAGHDTITSSISWCLYNLAKNPQCQQKCRDEVNEVIQERNSVVWQDLSKFNYLTQCIKESLRMYPPIPFTTRITRHPHELPDGRVIPIGADVGIDIYAIHHLPDVWPNPDVFDPERFSADNVAKRSPFAFIPFLAGARNCIGQHFAMDEMKTCVALLVKNFEFEVDESVKVEMRKRLSMQSKEGIWLKMKKVSTYSDNLRRESGSN